MPLFVLEFLGLTEIFVIGSVVVIFVFLAFRIFKSQH
jgi:hypothetical protein